MWFWYQNNASLIEWGCILSSSHFCMHLYRIAIISSLNVSWSFLCKKTFKYKFIFFDRYRVFRLLMSSWVSFGNLCFQWLCLSCHIYWHKVVHGIPYYSFNTHKISSDIISFITDIGNFCLLIFPPPHVLKESAFGFIAILLLFFCFQFLLGLFCS